MSESQSPEIQVPETHAASEQTHIIDPRKILVLSDSHGSLATKQWGNRLNETITREEPSTLVHLGDLVDKSNAETEAEKDDFHALMQALEQYPDLRFVHVSGGYDSYGPFDICVHRRPNSFTGGRFVEYPFTLYHDYQNFLRNKELRADIERRIAQREYAIVLYGHSHLQTLHECAYAFGISNDENIRPFKKSERIELAPGKCWFVNPGAFNLDKYCTIEKTGEVYSVTFH